MKISKSLVEIRPGLLGSEFDLALSELNKYFDLKIIEEKSGERLGTWVIPKAWCLIRAEIRRSDGLEILKCHDRDIQKVWQHSISFEGNIKLTELYDHITVGFTANVRNFDVAYYSNTWGFSLTPEEASNLIDGFDYFIKLETVFYDDALKVGISRLPGLSGRVLIDVPISFRELANNLTNTDAALSLYQFLSSRERLFEYNFIFTPETIGVPLLLKKCPNLLMLADCGISIMGMADGNSLHYKLSKKGDTDLDRIFKLIELNKSIKTSAFDLVVGSTCNEKAYNSCGFPGVFGRVSGRTPGSYDSYDTSLDNLNNCDAVALTNNSEALVNAFWVLENSKRFKTSLIGEPFWSGLNLGQIFSDSKNRFIYDSIVGMVDSKIEFTNFLVNMLGYKDLVDNALKQLVDKNILHDKVGDEFLTSRYLVKELRLKDINSSYLSWLNDQEVTRYLETPRTLSIAELSEFVSACINKDDCILFGIFDRISLQHIGNVKLEPISLNDNSAVMGIMIGDSAHRGIGVVPEVLEGLHLFALNRLNLSKIRLGVLKKNKAAIRAYEKCGYVISERATIFRSKTNSFEEEYKMEINLKAI
jgi:aminopeptidase-like protein